jgi:hypothetical protein
VNQPSGDVKGEESKHPQHQQNNKQSEKHQNLLGAPKRTAPQ